MKFLLLVYTDPALMEQLPPGEYEAQMRQCIVHADDMRERGRLLDSKKLEAPSTARAVRIRNGRTSVTDGPFAETKEVLGGFNLIEADSMEEEVRIAEGFPWAKFGCMEVRPVDDLDVVRREVGA